MQVVDGVFDGVIFRDEIDEPVPLLGVGGSDSFVFVEGSQRRGEKEDPKTVADASTVRRPGKCHRERVRDRIANDRHTDGSPRRNECTKSEQNLVS